MKRQAQQNLKALHKAIGSNLQQQRMRLGLGLLEIELATQLSADTIKAYEKGEKPISTVDLVKLSQYFGVSPQVLLEDIPTLVEQAAPAPSYGGFSEAHVQEFQQNFLKVTGPNRGDKFKRFIQKISDEDKKNNDTEH